MAGPIRIAVLANASQARRELDGVTSTTERISSRFASLRLPAIAALGGIAVGAKKAVEAASDVNEEVSKSQEIFGKQAAGIEAFANRADTALGQSKVAALDATSTFGQIGQKAGLSGKETAKFATQFTTLSSDLASFNNTTPEEAITAIGAAMRGESEPIRKYGVLLDDATLRARAMKMGLIETTSQALTPQQKALAASSEILAQTTKAQGDFARTADGAANKQRILAAQAENTKAKLGQALLPAYQAVLNVASKFVGVMSEHPGAVQAVIVAVAALAVGVLAVSVATSVASAATTAWAAATKAATLAQQAFNFAMRANPIGLVVTAIALLVAALVVAYKKSETFRKIVDAAWAAIKAATTKVFGAIQKTVETAWAAIKGVVTTTTRTVEGVVTRAWNAIKTWTSTVWNAMKNTILVPMRVVIALLTGNTDQAKQVVTGAWDYIKSATSRIWDGIKSAVGNAISALLDKVRGIKASVTGAFAAAGSWLLDAGRRIIQGLLDGIGNMIGKVKSKLGEVTNLIPDWKGPKQRDKRLLTPAGEAIIGGLVDGFERQFPSVRRTLSGLTREIAGTEASIDGTISVKRRPADALLATTHVAATPPSTEITINVTAPVGASSADIGRDLQKHLTAFLASGGRVVATA